MNRERRAALRKIEAELAGLQSRVLDILNEESDSFENLPENFQMGDMGEEMQDNIESMSDAIECMEKASGILWSLAEV